MDYSIDGFERFYREHYRQMYRVAYTLTEDTDDAKDAVSQVFAQLWQSQPAIDDDHLQGYLQVAVRNQCLYLLRQQASRRQLSVELVQDAHDVEEDYAHRDMMEALNRYIDAHLSSADRAILQLHYEENLTYEETAESLGLTPSYVNKRITHSLALLRRKMKKTKQ